MKIHSQRNLAYPFCSLLVFVATVVTAQAQFVLSNMWSLSTTSGVAYVSTDNSQRGIAYNPINNHLYLVSRTGAAAVHILDPANGADLGTLDLTGVSGGGGAILNLVDVADDGSIYICNLATTAGTFKLYRYADESSAPVNVFNGDPTGGFNGDTTTGDTNAVVTNSKRFGDNLTVRGSGTNVQVLVNSRGGRASALLFPLDESMQMFGAQTILTDSSNGDIGLGVAFGKGNSYWAKAPSRNLRRFGIANPLDIYNPAAVLVATTIVNIAVSPTTTAGMSALPDSNLLAINDYGGHTLRLYDTSSEQGISLQDSKPFPLPAGSNANGTGMPEFGVHNGAIYLFSVDSNNGVLATAVQAINAPLITGGPNNLSIIDGGYGALSVQANGTPPLVYYWYLNTDKLVGVATNNPNLLLTNVSVLDAGLYSVTVSNATAKVSSTNATLTITPSVRTAASAPLWKIVGGGRPYLSTSDLCRGAAVNPVNGHLLVLSRVNGYHIYVLDGATGADLWEMNTDSNVVTGSSPAGFDLNMVAVAEDGAVYACNLHTGGSAVRIYKWENDSATTPPVMISDSDPGFVGHGRFGDTIIARGAGATTQVLLPSQDQAFSVLLTTFEGAAFFSTVLAEDVVDNTRLGIAFGEGNTYWSKAVTNLVHFGFDPATGVATNIQKFEQSTTFGYPIGTDVPNRLIAEQATIGQNPDNLRIYDFSFATTNAPVLMDQEFYASDNANINGVGSVAFDVARGRLFALNSNNGLIALKYAPPLRFETVNGRLVLNWAGPAKLIRSSEANGTYTELPGAVGPYTNTAAGPLFFRLQY